MNVSRVENSAISDRGVFNVSQAGGEDIRFNQGEILKGVVLRIKSDGTINLLVNDKVINAVSEVDVKPGQQMYLLVDSSKDSQDQLKMILPPESAPMGDNGLSAAFRSFGAPSNADIALIADKLFEHNLPATLQNITEIINAMNMADGISARSLEVAVFAMEHNIPLDKNILPLIHQFIVSDGDLSRMTRELVQLLVRMEAAVGSSSSAAPSLVISSGSSNQFDAAALNLTGTGGGADLTPNAASGANDGGVSPASPINTASVIHQGVYPQSGVPPSPVASAWQTPTPAIDPTVDVPVNAVAPGVETAGGGADSANNLPVAANPAPIATGDAGITAATGDAGSIPANVPGTVPNNTAHVITADSAPEGGAVHHPSINFAPAARGLEASATEKPFDLIEQVKLLREILESSIGKVTGSRSDVNPILHNIVKERPLLVDNLRLLLDMIKAGDAPSKTFAGQELLAKISNLHQQITGQALFNSVAKFSQNVLMNDYYFSFPVEIDDQLTYCQFRLQKNTRSRLGTQESIKFVVSLDTPALGVVLFHVDWHRQGYIQLRGVVETSDARSFMEENIAGLILGLNELGYSVNNLGIKTAGDPKELIIKPLVEEEESNTIGPYSVDVIA